MDTDAVMLLPYSTTLVTTTSSQLYILLLTVTAVPAPTATVGMVIIGPDC